MFWPQAQDEASDDYYTNSKALYPGTKTTHLMFPTVYRRQVDSTMVRLASSADGKVWTWAPGTIMEPGTEGSWDGGCLFASFGLTEIPGERVALPYTGYRFPHKFPLYVRVGEIGLAVWRKERLVALTPPEEGEFYTRPMVLRGSTLHVNFQARRAVGIQVEVLQRGKTIKGRGWQDCDVLWGDSLQAAVTWKGSRIWVFPGQAVQFRFRLRAAKMFSFDVKAI